MLIEHLLRPRHYSRHAPVGSFTLCGQGKEEEGDQEEVRISLPQLLSIM